VRQPAVYPPTTLKTSAASGDSWCCERGSAPLRRWCTSSPPTKVTQLPVEALGTFLKARFPSITTLVHSRRRQKAQIANGESSRTLWGPGYIEEQLGQLRFADLSQFFLSNQYRGHRRPVWSHQPVRRVHRPRDPLGSLLRRWQHRPLFGLSRAPGGGIRTGSGSGEQCLH